MSRWFWRAKDNSCSANGVGLVFNLLWVATNAAQLPIWCVTNATSASLNSCGVSTGLFLASSLQIVSDGLATKNDCAYLQRLGFYILFGKGQGSQNGLPCCVEC